MSDEEKARIQELEEERARAQELEEEVSRLRLLLVEKGEERPDFLEVKNLTPNYLTLHHPSGDERKSRTLGPYQVHLMDYAFLSSEDFVLTEERGEISHEEIRSRDEIQEDLRGVVLGEDYSLQDPQLEAMALQFLFFPGDNLEDRSERGSLARSDLDVNAMAEVLWQIINRPAIEGNRPSVEYLKITHSMFLENVLRRERMWRKRAGIIEPIEKRLAEIRRMDDFGRIRS